ncbi:MAG: right-handed parallel beta-helix repeat-containing protein [Candidatus Moraniibacteriota bacterium]
MNQSFTSSTRGFLLGSALFLSILAPVFAFGGSDKIYVNDDGKGKEEGTYDHPYHTISKALKKAKEGSTVYVTKGRYKENITLPKGVRLIGEKDREKVVIKADNENQPTVTMKHDSELINITVDGGRHGVRIQENAKAKVYKSVIRDSSRDGIHIDSGSRDKKRMVTIEDTIIKNNRMAGIFSEKRNIVVKNNNIMNNGDGIDFTAGIKAWFEGNRIHDNQGSGAKFVLDGSSLWSKKNTFRDNKREGVEVNAYGESGNIGLKKAQIINNGRYGIARVARTPQGGKTFGGMVLDQVQVEKNHLGQTSPVLRAW